MDRLNPGTLGEARGLDLSMAQDIEDEFKDQWKYAMGGRDLRVDDQLRLLFVAVARGVIKHLRDNPRAFDVTVGPAGDALTGKVVEIH